MLIDCYGSAVPQQLFLILADIKWWTQNCYFSLGRRRWFSGLRRWWNGLDRLITSQMPGKDSCKAREPGMLGKYLGSRSLLHTADELATNSPRYI